MKPNRPLVPDTGARPEKRSPPLGGARPTRRHPGVLGRAGSHLRAVVAAAGGCAVVVAGSLVVANMHNTGQSVTVGPAAPGRGPVPGTIFVANSTAALPPGQPVGAGPGSITVYRPGATGDARPEAVITAGVDGPGELAFDASGDLWVANLTSSTVVEYSRAELATASPAYEACQTSSPSWSGRSERLYLPRKPKLQCRPRRNLPSVRRGPLRELKE
jgi:hypothetical protein